MNMETDTGQNGPDQPGYDPGDPTHSSPGENTDHNNVEEAEMADLSCPDPKFNKLDSFSLKPAVSIATTGNPDNFTTHNLATGFTPTVSTPFNSAEKQNFQTFHDLNVSSPLADKNSPDFDFNKLRTVLSDSSFDSLPGTDKIFTAGTNTIFAAGTVVEPA